MNEVGFPCRRPSGAAQSRSPWPRNRINARSGPAARVISHFFRSVVQPLRHEIPPTREFPETSYDRRISAEFRWRRWGVGAAVVARLPRRTDLLVELST